MSVLASVLIFVLLLSTVIILLVTAISPKQPQSEKLSGYECGFEPFGIAHTSFDIHFYLVAIIFIIFDLETLYLLVFSLALNSFYSLPFHMMALFLAILTLGFYYE
jgi:NADH-quinone oxidoreductase subunit A